MSDEKTPVIVEQPTSNPSQPEQDTPSSKPKPSPKQKHKTGLLGWFNLLLIVILSALFGFAAWYTLNNQQSSHSELAVLQDRLQTAQQQLSQLSTTLNALKQDESKRQQQIEHIQKTLDFNSTRLAKLPGAERQDWLLAEAEYLLRLANQRLQLEQDWQGALGLLLAADKVLLETRNPNVLKVRTTISQEMMALKAAPAIDKVGLVLRLQAIQNHIPTLPWLPEKFIPQSIQSTDEALVKQPLDEQVWYKKAWFSLRQSLASMVRIRKREAPVAPALTANQRYYLQQNMQLMLEQAQMAVLRNEAGLYQQSLARVQGWIRNYIQSDNSSTQAIQEGLQELNTINIAPVMPNISQSLKQLQELVMQQRRLPDNAPEQTSKAGEDA